MSLTLEGTSSVFEPEALNRTHAREAFATGYCGNPTPRRYS